MATVIDITKPRYRRAGGCNKCGECCVEENCEHFEWVNGKGICKTHPVKPEKCVLFPANPPIVFKKCSYYFWDTWEKREIKTGDKL